MDLELLQHSMPDLHQATVSEVSLEDMQKDRVLERYAKRFKIYTKDFSKHLFRPHAIFNLMGGIPKPLTERQLETLEAYQLKIDTGKGLTDKQYIDYGSLLSKKNAKPILSPGAVKYLKELFKELTFQRTKELKSKYLDKGLAVEHLSIEMLNEVFGYDFEKNSERFENDWFSGEPDIINNDEVIDIKSSWDFTTFPMMDEEIENQNYFYQLQAYMDLLGLDKARLIYVLVDTPMQIIQNEKYKVSSELGLLTTELQYDLPDDLDLEIERNLTYEDIPKEARIKIFEVQKDEETLKNIKTMITLARQYLVELNNSIEKRFVNHINN